MEPAKDGHKGALVRLPKGKSDNGEGNQNRENLWRGCIWVSVKAKKGKWLGTFSNKTV